MIKITVQEPTRGGVDCTPMEVLVPAVPKKGDGFRLNGGAYYIVSHVEFRQETNNTCSVLVLLSSAKVSDE